MKYTVRLSKTRTETATVIVDAETPVQAVDNALLQRKTLHWTLHEDPAFAVETVKEGEVSL